MPFLSKASSTDLPALRFRLTNLSEHEARALAKHWTDSRFATKARARVLHPKTEGVVSLLDGLNQIGATLPLPRDSAEGARAYAVACDALIAAHGRSRLTPAQYLTLVRPAWHGWSAAG